MSPALDMEMNESYSVDKESLVKQIEHLQGTIKAQKRRYHKVEAENEDLKKRVKELEKEVMERNKPEIMFRNYFDCLAMAVQMNAQELGVHIDVNNEELFQRVMQEQVPWNHWPDWVTAHVLDIDFSDDFRDFL